MRLKFWERQTVETRDYTVDTTDRLANQLTNDSAVRAARPAVIEACAGLWARGFASAQVEPVSPTTAALTPSVLAAIGRRLFENGEALFEIQVRAGAVRLLEVASHEVLGTDPLRWQYRLDIPTPESLIRRFRPAEAVLHLRYAGQFAEPWKGCGPIGNAETSRSLAAALELRLSQEANSSVGNVIPSPDAAQDSGLQADIRNLMGGNILVPSMRSESYTGGQTPPRNDWQPQRLGANWPESLQPMRADVSDHIAAAAGVPAALLSRQVDGTGRREAWRQFLHGTVQPVAKLITGELQDKLDTPGLVLNFDELFASDLQGRARSFQSMVQGGMDVERAAALSGLIAQEAG